jgi:hypothetical protein
MTATKGVGRVKFDKFAGMSLWTVGVKSSPEEERVGAIVEVVDSHKVSTLGPNADMRILVGTEIWLNRKGLIRYILDVAIV